MDIATSSQPNEDIDNQVEHLGEYKQEVLIDKKKSKQIQKEKFNLSNYSGFLTGMLTKLGIKSRKHHLYYGLNIREKALDISLTSNKVMISLLNKKDIQEKLKQIKP
ncbi:hypothetical protein ACOSP7_018648 [Xanthoceras sorbifolium]